MSSRGAEPTPAEIAGRLTGFPDPASMRRGLGRSSPRQKNSPGTPRLANPPAPREPPRDSRVPRRTDARTLPRKIHEPRRVTPTKNLCEGHRGARQRCETRSRARKRAEPRGTRARSSPSRRRCRRQGRLADLSTSSDSTAGSAGDPTRSPSTTRLLTAREVADLLVAESARSGNSLPKGNSRPFAFGVSSAWRRPTSWTSSGIPKER